jgi:hypothetical protein
MRIEVLFFKGCPNYAPTVERLRTVLRQEGLSTDAEYVEVADAAAAQRLGFIGSPTIRINGVDIEPELRTSAQTGVACRRYSGGLPSEEMIRAAIREAMPLSSK